MSDEFKHLTNCKSCGSSDANAVYTSGNTHCFSCSKTIIKNTDIGEPIETNTDKPDLSSFMRGDITAIPSRRLSEATCQRFGYMVNDEHPDEDYHIAPYYNELSELCAQGIRGVSTKSFRSR